MIIAESRTDREHILYVRRTRVAKFFSSDIVRRADEGRFLGRLGVDKGGIRKLFNNR